LYSRSIRLLTTLTVLAGITVAHVAWAQWPFNGGIVCDAANTQGSPIVVSDGNGGCIVTWQDVRSGNSDIYAQGLDSGGNPLTLRAQADALEKKASPWHVVGHVALSEALVAVNAGLAAAEPRGYGVIAAILFPIAAASYEDASSTTRWVGLATAEGIAVYDIAVNTDRITDQQIFVANVIGWHVLAAAVFTTKHFTQSQHPDAKTSLRYEPSRDGGMLTVSYRF